MALKTCLLVLVVLIALHRVHAGEDDILTDFIVTPDGMKVNSSYFTFRGLNESLSGRPKNASIKITKVSNVEFPVLTGQSISLAILQYAPGAINPLHTHPRSAELLLLLQGTLNVGFVDSTNKLYSQVLNTGDVFIFPKGLIHFQINTDPINPAVAVSSFCSANAGTVSLPKAVFGSGITNKLLAESFNADNKTIDDLVLANMV